MSPAPQSKRVIIVGAGPSGLVTLKTLLHLSPQLNRKYGSRASPAFDPVILELSDKVGGTFDQRAYENGTLVSSKQITAFSDYRFGRDDPDHATMGSYVEYLERYVARFGLDSRTGKAWNGTELERKSRIQLGTRVLRVEKDTKTGEHLVTVLNAQGETFTLRSDALALCTGLHVLPAVPEIPGIPENLIEQSPPVVAAPPLPLYPPVETWNKKDQAEHVRVIHSSQYKERSEFKDRRVLILGIGETSMDLSYEAIQGGAKEVVVCHRGGFLSFPKVLNDFQVFGFKFDGDLPIDGLITNLFETAYVHPWVAASHLRWFISDFVIKRVLYLLTGTSAGCSQWIGSLPPSRLGRAYVFLNKSSRAMPYINAPYKPRSRLFTRLFRTEYIDPPFPPTPCQQIDLALWPSHVTSDGIVRFTSAKNLPQSNGIKRLEEERMKTREVKPDLVVYATGYRQDWSWLGDGYEKGPGRVDVREVTSSKDRSVGWIGFVRPGVGAIPPIAEQQAMLWTLLLLDEIPVPTSKPHYRLLASYTARIQYGVDHSAYMSTLARDMGAAPSLSTLYHQYGLHVLLCYCFGAAFGPFYRLTGPFASPDEMSVIVEGELWETITRRGIAGNLFMGVIPMLFYAGVNAIAWLLERLWILVGKPFSGRQDFATTTSTSDRRKKVA